MVIRLVVVLILINVIIGIESNNTSGIYNFSHVQIDSKEVEPTIEIEVDSIPEEGEKGDFENLKRYFIFLILEREEEEDAIIDTEEKKDL